MTIPGNGRYNGTANGTAEANGSSNGHAEPAVSKIGKPIFVGTRDDLVGQMRRLVLDAIDAERDADQLEDAVYRRRAMVMHHGPDGWMYAAQAVRYIQKKFHAERVGTLDVKDMGFFGPPEDFLDWFEEATSGKQFLDTADFWSQAEARTKWEPEPRFELGDGDLATAAERVKPRARLIRASDIKIKPIEWLWEPRVPLGMLTLFAGDPKLGKSLTTIGMAAAVSCGKALPLDRQERSPASVIVMSAEDDIARVIVPRLKAAGACMDRVHILESIIVPESAPTDGRPEQPPAERLPSILRHDISTIEDAAAELGDCRLIIIDPVTAYIPGVDDHKNTDLRGVLWPLKAMAERLNIALVLVTHMSKGGASQAKHRVIGSIAWVGACRANFLFVKDANDPSGRRVLMCDNGTNLAPEVPTLGYTIEDRGDGPTVAWGMEPLAITADEALQALGRDSDQQAERRELDDWLREILQEGPKLVDIIEKAAKHEKLSWEAVKRAKSRIDAQTERKGFGKGSTCYWRLPNDSTDST